MATTARQLLQFNVLRVLCRADKLGGYAGMVADWNNWHPGPPSLEQLKARLPEFIQHYCDLHGIDPRFFLAAASAELRQSHSSQE